MMNSISMRGKVIYWISGFLLTRIKRGVEVQPLKSHRKFMCMYTILHAVRIYTRRLQEFREYTTPELILSLSLSPFVQHGIITQLFSVSQTQFSNITVVALRAPHGICTSGGWSSCNVSAEALQKQNRTVSLV